MWFRTAGVAVLRPTIALQKSFDLLIHCFGTARCCLRGVADMNLTQHNVTASGDDGKSGTSRSLYLGDDFVKCDCAVYFAILATEDKKYSLICKILSYKSLCNTALSPV